MEISPGMMPAGIQAIQNGQQQMTEAAQNIASTTATSANPTAPTADIADLTTQLLQLEQAQQMTEAGARVVQTADETLGTLIDTTA